MGVESVVIWGGVSREYDSTHNLFIYSVNTNIFSPKSPRDLITLTRTASDAIWKDMRKNNAIDSASLRVGGKYAERFRLTLSELKETADSQRRKYGKITDVAFNTFGIAGFVAGLGAGYYYGSNLSVRAGEYLNNISPLFAPVSGVVEIGGSVLATGVGAAAGAISGALACLVVGTIPFRTINAFNLNAKEYQVLDSKNWNIAVD
jgi:hypothetical protein